METTGTFTLDRSESLRARLKDFYDLTKPRMNVVVLATTLAGYYLAAKDPVDGARLMFTLIGAALAAAGASALNQVMERDFDALMPRTADRPIPAGRIGASEACLFGLLLAVTGIALLAIDVNTLT